MRINVTEKGIRNDGAADCSAALTKLLAECEEDSELFFPEGRYYLEHAVAVENKKRLTLRGEKAVLLTHFSPCGEPGENNDGFHVRGCEELRFENFTATTDNPISCAGRVTAVDPEKHTYDIRIADEFPVTGWEHFGGTDTCDDEGSPDYVIETCETFTRETLTDENGKERVKLTGTPYEVIDGQNIRVKVPERFDLTRLRIGHRVLYRYIIYGNSLFVFSDCRNVTLSHIEVERCASVGAVIKPRCEDFTFESFHIRVPSGSEALYASNADGIHIIGLQGRLVMKNCFFDGLGDDALNIHSKAGEIVSLDRETGHLECISRDLEMQPRPLPQNWAAAGDTIAVYDRNTFLKKGTLTLDGWADSAAHVTSVNGSADPGDILANEAFFASVLLENCHVRNTRARGFLLQSKNMVLDGCSVWGTSLPAVILSPDIRRWYEVGPSENTEIRNCRFEKCAFIENGANLGAIVVKASHDIGASDYPAGVHKDVRIRNNEFADLRVPGVYLSATDGATVQGNRFSDVGDREGTEIRFCHVRSAVCDGNVSDRGPVVIKKED